jgi:hypothetical protein
MMKTIHRILEQAGSIHQKERNYDWLLDLIESSSSSEDGDVLDQHTENHAKEHEVFLNDKSCRQSRPLRPKGRNSKSKTRKMIGKRPKKYTEMNIVCKDVLLQKEGRFSTISDGLSSSDSLLPSISDQPFGTPCEESTDQLQEYQLEITLEIPSLFDSSDHNTISPDSKGRKPNRWSGCTQCAEGECNMEVTVPFFAS